MSWSVYYAKAIKEDGTLFFPERLGHDRLEALKRSMGSYVFANQYQNEIIPLEDAPFKKEWIRYGTAPVGNQNRFFFIDPALSTKDGADYTALVGITVTPSQDWYVTHASRQRITPTDIVNLIFRVHKEFQPVCIGVEDVAYQKALLYMLAEEMRRRNTIVPVRGIRPTPDKTKESRIMGLVPRFEWGRIYLSQGLYDLETEYTQFPRSSHDDLLDALAYMEQIVIYPKEMREDFLNGPEPSPNHPRYEQWYIHRKLKPRAPEY